MVATLAHRRVPRLGRACALGFFSTAGQESPWQNAALRDARRPSNVCNLEREAGEQRLGVRAHLGHELGEMDYQLRALRALWAEAINNGEFRHALALAERFHALALETERVDHIVSDRLIGTALHFLGEHEKAETAI